VSNPIEENPVPPEQVKSVVDRPVVTERGQSIGKVADVVFDTETLRPRWAIVKVPLKGQHWMPLSGSYLTDGDERLVVPFDKTIVSGAPKAGEHVVSRDLEEELIEHYGLAS